MSDELQDRLYEAANAYMDKLKYDANNDPDESYLDKIVIEPFMDGTSLLIEVSGHEFGDNDQPEFLNIVENAKIFIRQYFAEKGWEDEL